MGDVLSVRPTISSVYIRVFRVAPPVPGLAHRTANVLIGDMSGIRRCVAVSTIGIPNAKIVRQSDKEDDISGNKIKN